MEKRTESINVKSYGFPHQPLVQRSNALFQWWRWAQREVSHVSERSFTGKSLQWIRCPDPGESTCGSSRACKLLCRPADSFFAVCAHLLQVAEFLFKPNLQGSTFFSKILWYTLMECSNGKHVHWRLNWCSLEVRRAFTILPGFSCFPWAQAVCFPLLSLQQTFWSCHFSVLLSHCNLAVSAKIVGHVINSKYRWQKRIPTLDNSV